MQNTITPKPWTNGLFSVATEINSSAIAWDGSAWQLYSACPSGGLWTCDDTEVAMGGGAKKVEPADGNVIPFIPFTAYQITACSGGTSRLEESMKLNDKLADDWLAANLEGWVSAGLEIGVGANPGLQSLTDVTPVGGAESIPLAVSLLVKSRQAGNLYDRPILHLPADAAPALSGLLDDIKNVVDVVLGPGYGVISPTGDTAGTGWAYLTGPVEYSLGAEPEPIILGDGMAERRRNYDDSQRERLVNVRYDPCGGYRTQFLY